MIHVMLDLETLSSRSDASIVSVGACIAPAVGSEIKHTFYEVVNRESQDPKIFHVCPTTVEWWSFQSKEAREVLKVPGEDIKNALGKFSSWLHALGPAEKILMWGNGASFDNAILEHAYKVCDIEVPWKFWNNRCYRTLKNIVYAPFKHVGEAHNALDDAKSQALHLKELLKKRRGRK